MKTQGITKPPGKAASVRRRTRPLSRGQWSALLALTLVPAVLIGFKCSGLPGSESVAGALSFRAVPHAMLARLHHLLFTPVGAMVVVFVRLTLGVRVLGPFRSILLAVAFQVTGTLLGMAFFALVIGVVVCVRPALKRLKMPYFGRSSALLAAVAGTIVLATLIGVQAGITEVERLAYFPVVVLTLAGEAFAGTLRREGIRSALWRATATSLVAAFIAALAGVPLFQDALVRFPEVELWCLAAVILTSRLLAFRVFQSLNPAPVKKRRKKKPAAKSAKAPIGVSIPEPAAPVPVEGVSA